MQRWYLFWCLHTLLWLTGGVAYRGVYTGELANQIRQANGWISVHDMHSEAVASMYRKCGSVQTAVYRDTLQRKLLMPGKMWTYCAQNFVLTQKCCGIKTLS